MKVLMVCLGNICRSPAAQGVLEFLARKHRLDIQVDSAGTAAYHIGKRPDARSIAALAEIGIDISQQRARQVSRHDFEEFDWILAMDRDNLNNLAQLAPAQGRAKIALLGEYRNGLNGGEVADPYWGEAAEFAQMREHLMDLLQDFISEIKS